MCNIDALKCYKKNDIYCHKRLTINIFEISQNSLGLRGKNLRNVEISLCRDRPTIRPHIIFCIVLLKFLAHYGIVNTIIPPNTLIKEKTKYACNCRYMTSVLYVWPKNMRFFLFITKYTYLYVIMSKIIMKIY